MPSDLGRRLHWALVLLIHCKLSLVLSFQTTSLSRPAITDVIRSFSSRQHPRVICPNPAAAPRILASAATDAAGTTPVGAITSEFPWAFEGRVWFQPALVRAPATPEVAPGVTCLSLFGWTLGGVVCLEYDASPAGPYLEVVEMGALVASSGGGVGQWGSRLWVSTAPAEELCRAVWGVPAELRPLRFARRSAAVPAHELARLIRPDSCRPATRRRCVSRRRNSAGRPRHHATAVRPPLYA
jgi:hypothetical protein